MTQENNIKTPLQAIIEDDGTPIDISTASTKEIVFLKEGETASVTETAVFTTDGTDGAIEYAPVADFLTPGGLWRYQGRVVLGTQTFKSAWRRFLVKENL